MVDKIVFEAKPNISYQLYFGNASASAPKFDIESYKSHIEIEPQDVCGLGTLITQKTESAAAADNKKGDSKFLFNIIIIVTAIALISLLIIKLRPKNS